MPILGYYHSFNFLGRSANLNAALPYAVGNFQGNVAGQPRTLYRSGLLDFTSRISVNLKGGPSMPIEEFMKWRQKTLLGVSLKVLAPTGQYDPTKLVNWGTNRWAFKPELGYSRRWRNWFLDSYGGAWFYTTNPRFYSPPSPKPQTESPIGSFEGHLSYDVKPKLWFSLDGNFWFGGVTSLSGLANSCYASNELPHWRHSCYPIRPTPIGEGQLQQWRLHPVWRKLSESFRRVAVLLVRLA